MVAGQTDVVEYDVESNSLREVSGGGHRAVWALVRRNGVPQALLETDRDALAAAAAAIADAGAGPLGVRDEDLPPASVVVASIVERLDDLDRCLADLGRLDYPQFEVVLVDNRPQRPDPDPLPAIVAKHPHVRLAHQSVPGAAVARNLGAQLSTGQVIAFTDDDVRVDPGWLKALARRFVAEPALDAVTGLILPAELATEAQVYFERYYGGFAGERIFRRLTLSTGSGLAGRGRLEARADDGSLVRRHPLYGMGAYGAGANMAVRRKPFGAAHGFDPMLGPGTPAKGGEDLSLLIRLLWAGGQVGYEPAAFVYHRHRPEYDELLSQLRTYGSGFTAMLTSLAVRDPRHVAAIAAQLPEAAGRLVGQVRDRLTSPRGATAASADRPYPRELVRTEMLGMPAGPLAYARSRWHRRSA